jgi:beta-1,4-mannosyltransferase
MNRDADSVRIVSSEPTTAANPYLRLFYDALRPHGFELTGTFVPSRRWLHEHGESFDVIHFHWLEWLVRSEPDRLGFLQSIPGGWRLANRLRPFFPWAQLHELRSFLRSARARKKTIVWTCHNVEPHEDATWPVRAAFRALAQTVDLVICHDKTAHARCAALYAPTGRMAIMKHGNYDGVYPRPRPRDEVLREIGLPASRPIVLCAGQLRPYKGTDLVCDAVARLGDRVSLLIAGPSHIPSYARQVEERVRKLSNAVFLNRHLTDQEFADFVYASDLVLLPYRSVTGSGSAFAALTLGRGVIASDLPFFVELLRHHENAGRVFTAGDARSMAAAVLALLEVAPEDRERAALSLASQHEWKRLVPGVARSLRELAAAS